MKKYLKLLLITLIGFLTFNGYVMAKEVNLDQLGQEIENVNKNATFAYIIGNHAYTSARSITLEDVMIASRSITVDGVGEEYDYNSNIKEDNVYKKMNIFQIRKSRGKWVSGSNLIGAKTLSQYVEENGGQITIDYIDYKYVAKDTVISISTDTASYKKDLDQKYVANAFQYNPVTKEVSGLAKINEGVTQAAKNTNYYFAYVLHVEGATNETTIDLPDSAKIVKKDLAQGNYVILMALTTDTDNYYYVKVDKDGAKTHYNTATYALHFTGVEYQTYTKVDFDLDNENIAHYVKEEGENVTLAKSQNTMQISNKLYKQFEVKEFSDNQDAYYISLTANKKLADVKVTLNDSSDDVKITKEDDKTTIIFRITEEKMTACKGQNSDECKFKIVVDEDGDSAEKYLASTYELEFGGITPKVMTKVNEAKVEAKNSAGELVKAFEDNNQQLVGYLKTSNKIKYSLTTQEKPVEAAEGVVKVSGSAQAYNSDSFAENKLDIEYEVKEIENKEFTLTVDLDGDETKYDPTTITVDYEGLFTGENAETKYSAYITKTKAAVSLTVHNIVEDWLQKYQKGAENREITNYFSRSINPGIQAYTFNMNGKPYLSLNEIKKLSSEEQALYRVKALARNVTFNGQDVETEGEWKFIFNGWSGMGVAELSLIEKITGVPEEKRVNEITSMSEEAKQLLADQDVTYYNIKIAAADVKAWIEKYYDHTLASSYQDELTLTIAIDKAGYIRYISNLENTYGDGKKGWEEEIQINSQKYDRQIEMVLADIGSTIVPDPESLGLTNDKVKALETKWHADHGCVREHNYYVCKP